MGLDEERRELGRRADAGDGDAVLELAKLLEAEDGAAAAFGCAVSDAFDVVGWTPWSLLADWRDDVVAVLSRLPEDESDRSFLESRGGRLSIYVGAAHDGQGRVGVRVGRLDGPWPELWTQDRASWRRWASECRAPRGLLVPAEVARRWVVLREAEGRGPSRILVAQMDSRVRATLARANAGSSRDGLSVSSRDVAKVVLGVLDGTRPDRIDLGAGFRAEMWPDERLSKVVHLAPSARRRDRVRTHVVVGRHQGRGGEDWVAVNAFATSGDDPRGAISRSFGEADDDSLAEFFSNVEKSSASAARAWATLVLAGL